MGDEQDKKTSGVSAVTISTALTNPMNDDELALWANNEGKAWAKDHQSVVSKVIEQFREAMKRKNDPERPAEDRIVSHVVIRSEDGVPAEAYLTRISSSDHMPSKEGVDLVSVIGATDSIDLQTGREFSYSSGAHAMLTADKKFVPSQVREFLASDREAKKKQETNVSQLMTFDEFLKDPAYEALRGRLVRETKPILEKVAGQEPRRVGEESFLDILKNKSRTLEDNHRLVVQSGVDEAGNIIPERILLGEKYVDQSSRRGDGRGGFTPIEYFDVKHSFDIREGSRYSAGTFSTLKNPIKVELDAKGQMDQYTQERLGGKIMGAVKAEQITLAPVPTEDKSLAALAAKAAVDPSIRGQQPKDGAPAAQIPGALGGALSV